MNPVLASCVIQASRRTVSLTTTSMPHWSSGTASLCDVQRTPRPGRRSDAASIGSLGILGRPWLTVAADCRLSATTCRLSAAVVKQQVGNAGRFEPTWCGYTRFVLLLESQQRTNNREAEHNKLKRKKGNTCKLIKVN